MNNNQNALISTISTKFDFSTLSEGEAKETKSLISDFFKDLL